MPRHYTSTKMQGWDCTEKEWRYRPSRTQMHTSRWKVVATAYPPAAMNEEVATELMDECYSPQGMDEVCYTNMNLERQKSDQANKTDSEPSTEPNSMTRTPSPQRDLRMDFEDAWGQSDVAIVPALSAVYSSLVAVVQQQRLPQKITRFHSKVAPSIGIDVYLQRIQTYFKCSDSCHVVALIYIDRAVKMHSDFVVTDLTIHRLLAAATVLSAKFLDDIFYSNAYYAKVCGLGVKEMNLLESTFLSLVQWKLDVSVEEYNAYLCQVRSAVRLGVAEQ